VDFFLIPPKPLKIWGRKPPGYGEAVADDIGGAIIDLAMESKDEAFEWGVKHVTAYILSEK
jgi:3D (Asp-Asp-Asp) domain-containing protein